jgi:hypothetical protein
MRKDDKNNENFERTERVYEGEAGWYFTIRQGAAFGPYHTKEEAMKGLESFTDLLKK